MAIRVLIADDQPLMRTAIGMSLTAESGIEVVGEAGNGAQAIELAGRLQPEVVVMDIRMPAVDGITATRLLTDSAAHRSRVLVMTTFDYDDYVVEALRAGASGFILKDATAAELVHAVRVVATGEALLAPSITRKLLDRYARQLPPAQSVRPPRIVGELTRRERAVLMLVARGMSNAEIGRELHLADSSVKTHVSHLLAKLDKQDRVQLVIFAYEAGLVHPAGGLLRAD